MSESVEQLHLLALNVGLAKHHADWNWQDVNSPFARIYYVTEGRAELVLPDRTHLLRSGYMYFVPPFTTHSCRCDDVFVHYYLHLYEDAPTCSGFLEEWKFPIEVEGGELERLLFERLCTLNPHMALPQSDPKGYDNPATLEKNIIKNRQGTLCNRVESRGIVFQLFARFLRGAVGEDPSIDERIRRSMVYIRQHIGEAFSLDKLAEDACLSKDHYIRLFKKGTGSTPQQYINQKKIEQAQLILLTEDVIVKSLAYRLGFDDCSYFGRMFRLFTGYSPLQYRKVMKHSFTSGVDAAIAEDFIE